VVGEFDDGALMTAFGREGRGVFMSPGVLEKETVAHYGVEVIGLTDELVEEFFCCLGRATYHTPLCGGHHPKRTRPFVQRLVLHRRQAVSSAQSCCSEPAFKCSWRSQRAASELSCVTTTKAVP